MLIKLFVGTEYFTSLSTSWIRNSTYNEDVLKAAPKAKKLAAALEVTDLRVKGRC